MIIKKQLVFLSAVILAPSFISGNVLGAGFALIENSASGQGNAFAGGAAIADDSSTVYFNPAGMSRLTAPEMTVVSHVVTTEAKFTNKNSTAATAGSLTGPNSDGGSTSVVPNFYYVHPLNNAFALGLGITVPFGLTTEYDDNWVGRYHAVKSSVMTVNVNPSIAWQANEKISIGAGLNVQYINVLLSSAVDFGSICVAQEAGSVFPPGSCTSIGATAQELDGFADFEANDVSMGFNIGLLYALTPQTRAGLAFRSKVKHALEGDAKFTIPGAMKFLTAADVFVPADITASVNLPETISLSVYHEFSNKIALMADWTWTRWSNFNELRIDYTSSQPDSVTTESWNDTNRFSVGLNYELISTLKLRGGLAYDESPVSDSEHRTPRLPDNDRIWASIGMNYRFTKNISLDVGYSHLFIEEADSNNTFESSIPTLAHTLKGSYKSAVDIFSTQLNWRF